MIEDFKALKVEIPDEILAEQTEFAVWPENFESVILFCSLGTQWNIAPMGGFTGLNYGSVEAVLRINQVEDMPAKFADIHVMERAALQIFSQAAKD